jgi:general secretion pathway protein D
MTNDQGPMTNEFPMKNSQVPPVARPLHIGHSLVIGHWSLVTRTALCFLLAFAPLAPLLEAQTIRPGSSARSTTSGSRTTSGRTGSTSSGSRSANGQRTYRSNTELGDAMITIDPETRSLVIVTDEATHREMEAVIKTLDKPKPQVLIKVVFVEVTYNKGSDIGVEGGYTFNLENPVSANSSTRTTTTTNLATASAGNTSQTVTALSETLNTAASVGKAVGAESLFGLASQTSGFFVRAVADDWSATLRAIATKGKVEVLSRPSIMARNNQEAVIVVGSEVPFITNSRVTDQGQTINTITYDNIGIILRVTPFITSEGTVEMIVAPEISNLTDQTVPISDTVSSPVIAKRSAETVVVTPNGKTVVIGGLMETQRIDSVQKIPLLGDIPLLGMAFRRTIKSDQKKELMIFLTPTIVSNPASIDRVNAEELNRTELMDQSFSEAERMKFMDDLPPLPEPERMSARQPAPRATAVKTAAPAKKPVAPKTAVAATPKPARRNLPIVR